MQKITRVYVGNYGIDMAWYDGIVFDMTDPETGAPTDTIINLENGGGKTTLLSFVFSCFETAQEHFLKHIQNKNHRFSQYFARDGLPGVVLVEWEMPARVAGASPYRLVVGQVVSVKSNTERDDVDRVFFSFESTGALRFESVPAPKLTMAPANSMAEFMRWMHEAQKSTSDFFHTRTQQDWQKHLRDERLIDIEMLQLQVSFSAQEGGIDEGFLKFNSEPEFIRKFFDLTLDAERAASVRLAVVNTCDKLRRKPFFQKRLAELSTLQASLTQFDSLAQAYATASASQSDTLKEGSGLVLSLESRSKEQSATAESQTEQEAAQEKLVLENEQAEKKFGEEQVVLTALRHTRHVAAAETLKATTTKTLTDSKIKLRYVQAAKARCEIGAAEATKLELETQASHATEELQPWRTSAEKHGSILRRALYTEELKLRNDAKAEGAKELAACDSRGTLTKELVQLTNNETTFIKEQANLVAAEQAFETAKAQLATDLLLEANEKTSAAIERWVATATAEHTAEALRLQEATELRRQEQEWHAKAKTEGEEAARQEAAALQKQKLIAEGQAEQERLSQLPALRQAAEAETADPDSPALLIALDRLAHSSEREVSLSDVRLAELNSAKSSIEDTGVAGNSRDVNAVVARLRELGVKSAQPYNIYISKALPDADQARRLVASNPSRFMGICVAATEFQKARQIEEQAPKLTSPVVVSISALDAELSGDDRLTLSASDDARFNIGAAAGLLATLETQLSAESERRRLYAERQRDAQAGKQRLEAYLVRFGAAALQRAISDVTRLNAEAVAAKEHAAVATTKASECRATADQRQAESQKCGSTAMTAERYARDLERFAKTHEEGHAFRVERLLVIATDITAIAERRAEIALEQEKLEILEKDAYRAKVGLENQANQMGEERGALKYFDKSFDAVAYLAENPQQLTVLRELYANAAQTFETQEKDRLGLLHQQLEHARTQYQEKTKAFTKTFNGVQLLDMAPYLKGNFDALIPATNEEIEVADKASREADSALAVAKNQSKEFYKVSKPSYEPTPEMIELNEGALNAEIDLASSFKQASSDAAKTARIAAARAKELAKQADQEAKEALNVAKMLRSALALPDLLVADPIELLGDVNLQTTTIVTEFQSRSKKVEGARSKAHKAFDEMKTSAMRKELQDVEPEIAAQLQRNDFDAACADSQRLLEGIVDRIGTTQSSLDGMKEDFEACVGELTNLANSALTLLNSAVNNKKVPAGAPYVGGKSVIKMRARFHEISQEARRQALHSYLDSLIDSNIVPARGPELVAEALLRIHGKPLGLQMLKMVPDEALQYVTVDKIQNSGGEGVVMAMFLYLLINQLRSETQAKLKKTGGGPLILDNPFAKATTPALWKAQRLLAQSMDVQLIFATALPDYNTIGEFSRFNRLRKAGKNTKTGRWHLEVVDFKLREQEPETI
ncbi:MAG: hypothetical protein CVU31_02045 [Betaproteobacteria bacterium HGW-Betaproteobacteria-4]|jgi:hypothetical protein|nr:MAG: hypothetical protein CVU31_02045 [Betaproteobacteria bacterium HGW-Betaproteobacteria-4]